jgi:hypothetical protein
MESKMTTVRVKRDGGRGWHNIAPDRFDPKTHELAEDVATAQPEAGTESPVEKPASGVVSIPDGWQSMHWKQRVQLASSLTSSPIVATDGRSVVEQSDEIIARAVAARQPGLI